MNGSGFAQMQPVGSPALGPVRLRPRLAAACIALSLTWAGGDTPCGRGRTGCVPAQNIDEGPG